MSASNDSVVVTGKSHLYQSKATYFSPVSHKWQEGIFTIHENYLEFKIDADDTPFHLSLPLCTITSIEKKNSRLIYASIVIHVSSENHWFSSFPNRNAVYNLLELFWRSSLLSKSKYKRISETLETKPISPLGKKLLGILQESENNLVQTAKELDEQNQHLQDVEEYVQDLNADLTTSEKILHSLPFLSQRVSNGSPQCISGEKQPIIKRRKYKVTYTNSDDSQDNANEWEKGYIVIAGDVKLVDAEENIKYVFLADEVKLLMIVSPWELCLSYEKDGKTSSFKIMCPMLSQFHKVLSASPIFRDKIAYKGDCEDVFQASGSQSSMSMSSDSASSSSSQCMNDTGSAGVSESQQFKPELTDEEVEQISTVMNSLHTLATEVTKEHECQKEKIEKLLHQVQQTDVHIDANRKGIRKLS